MVKMNNLYVDKKVINIIDDNKDLDFSLKDDQMLVINMFFNSIKDIKININQESNSYIVINYSGYVYENANIDINCNIRGNNNKTVINVRTISESGHGNYGASVFASSNSKNNDIIEDLKAINENGSITFMPILKIDTNDVIAEHFATIGGINEEELFYLESKGISKEKGKEIIKKKFITNLFSSEFKQMLEKGKEQDE